MATILHEREHQEDRSALKIGLAAGLIAGLLFALAEMVFSYLLGNAFFQPLRMIGSIVLGIEALHPAYPLETAGLVGVALHMALSALYGVVFAMLLALLKRLEGEMSLLSLLGAVFGLLLWLVNFQLIAPLLFPQFLQTNQFWMGFIAHTLVFGVTLGSVTGLLSWRA